MTTAAVDWADRITGLTREAPDQLLAHPLNPKRHPANQRTALRAAMDSLGIIAPCTVNDRTGYLLDGHARVEEALTRGQASLPVLHVDLSDEEEALALLTMDPIGAMFEAEKQNTDALLRQVETNNAELQQFLAEQAEALGLEYGKQEPAVDPGADIDRAEELREKWGTGLGQLWEIGPHRLLIGDSTDRLSLDTLLNSKQAHLLWTDPPYGVSYVGKGKAALTIQYDDAKGLLPLLLSALGNCDAVSVECAPFYIAHPPGELSLTFGDAIRQLGWHLHQTLVWAKNRFVLGHSDYHYQHEPIYYGWTTGTKAASRGNAGGYWHGDNSQSSLLQFDRPNASELHPTMKPPELIALCVRNSSVEANIVLDPFLGSGSTMVACEQIGRICNGVEIDPRFAAVTLERMAGLGLEPRRTDG